MTYLVTARSGELLRCVSSGGLGSAAEGYPAVTTLKRLCAAPQTTSRRKPNAERCGCLHVGIVELVMTCAWQPASVRLPPNTFRLTSGVRNAGSAG
jgi:hypothetical protein